jgi:RecA/RadA recombinase
MELKDIIYGNGIIKGVVLGDSGKEYSCGMDTDTYNTWCTCPVYTFHKGQTTCKHQLFFIDNVENDKMAKRKKYKNIPSDCVTIDTLMGGGFPQGTSVAVYAESGRGKTILSAQMALSCIKNLDQDVMVLETEGNREQDYIELLDRFNQDRWKIDDKKIEDKLHFYQIISGFQSKEKAMVELLEMVGYKVEIDQSKKGDKYSITFRDCKPKLKEKDLKNSGIIIVDSLTEPIKSTIGHKSQNLPARSELISRFFSKLISIAIDYNICIVINHHASINPMQMFGRDFGKPYGGDEVLYNSKYILAIIDSDMKARATYGKSARRVMLMKHPFNATTGELFPINLKEDYGFTDDE